MKSAFIIKFKIIPIILINTRSKWVPLQQCTSSLRLWRHLLLQSKIEKNNSLIGIYNNIVKKGIKKLVKFLNFSNKDEFSFPIIICTINKMKKIRINKKTIKNTNVNILSFKYFNKGASLNPEK